MKQWYVHISGKNIGPLSTYELTAMQESGSVSPNHMIWAPGLTSWVALKNANLNTNAAVVNEVRPKAEVLQGLPPEAYGGFWVRAAAWVVDHCVLLIVNLFTAVPLAILYPDNLKTSILSSSINLVMSFMYFAILQAKLRGTPGKRLMGLVLIGTDMRRLTPAECLRRYIYFSIASLPLWAGVFAVGVHGRKQGWHDRWLNTLVVKQKDLDLFLKAQPKLSIVTQDEIENQKRAA